MENRSSTVPALYPERIALVEKHGARLTPLAPIGAQVEGNDLTSKQAPPPEVLQALEQEMANRGFLVFRNDKQLEVDDFLRASCWWGGKQLHSTHGVHPATPDGNVHIFRLSNDRQHGIPGVGPQWHNDGSFNPDTFSHSGYHIVRPAEKGGGTYFAHQGAAFDALPGEKQAYWRRLSSVNSASGMIHPLVHEHPLSGRLCIWLHLGMTGAVIEKLPDRDGFRLLNAQELKQLCHDYNDILDAGLTEGYAGLYEYRENDCVFIDNLAVAHRASPEAHLSTEQQGLRILHRSTVRGVENLAPDFGLPQQVNILGPSPFGEGVWQGGGIGFRWEDGIPMQN
ncbi:MAG: TauD/TfdA family dioxygenase [Natronospirillum sp.]|uniref:TauD/TfdA dioxygenase family protein n=1 Tax=Natronospirillum sp. TaxID=2812955 RepID=UPI0025E1AEA3|nr:TauD/TfdA family dioxygenase [Natronospirillum sp.]MCH8552636.1 TauD/TfdA family dioxygenase [Natronospirillum sp.]